MTTGASNNRSRIKLLESKWIKSFIYLGSLLLFWLFASVVGAFTDRLLLFLFFHIALIHIYTSLQWPKALHALLAKIEGGAQLALNPKNIHPTGRNKLTIAVVKVIQYICFFTMIILVANFSIETLNLFAAGLFIAIFAALLGCCLL